MSALNNSLTDLICGCGEEYLIVDRAEATEKLTALFATKLKELYYEILSIDGYGGATVSKMHKAFNQFGMEEK